MSESQHKTVGELISKLKQERDDLQLRMHLGKEDLQDEWSAMQEKLSALNERFQPLKGAIDDTADNVWESLKLLGSEVREGFDRIRKSL